MGETGSESESEGVPPTPNAGLELYGKVLSVLPGTAWPSWVSISGLMPQPRAKLASEWK